MPIVDHSIVLTNSKGGVGKSVLAASLAICASQGLAGHPRRTLLVDLDRQGNIRRDLGLVDSHDEGYALNYAILNRTQVEPVADVRPGLDVVMGGTRLAEAYRLCSFEEMSGTPGARERIHTTIAGIVDDYDLVIFDTGSDLFPVEEQILSMAHYVVMPITPDTSSVDGLGIVLEDLEDAHQYNPDLELLMMVLGGVHEISTYGQSIQDDVVKAMRGLAPLAPRRIRFSQASVGRAKELGLTPIEFGGFASQDLLPEGMNVKQMPKAAIGVGMDFLDNCRAILGEFEKRQTPEARKAREQAFFDSTKLDPAALEGAS